MTDRVHSLTVVLKTDIRQDDVQGIIDAIKWFSAVADVQANVSDSDSYVALTRARQEIRDKILAVIYPSDK